MSEENNTTTEEADFITEFSNKTNVVNVRLGDLVYVVVPPFTTQKQSASLRTYISNYYLGKVCVLICPCNTEEFVVNVASRNDIKELKEQVVVLVNEIEKLKKA